METAILVYIGLYIYTYFPPGIFEVRYISRGIHTRPTALGRGEEKFLTMGSGVVGFCVYVGVYRGNPQRVYAGSLGIMWGLQRLLSSYRGYSEGYTDGMYIYVLMWTDSGHIEW